MKVCLTFLMTLRLIGDVYSLNEHNKIKYGNIENIKDKTLLHNERTGLLNDNNLCPNLKTRNILLSRKKRTLSFPDNTSFLITFSLVKAILIGLPLGWNQALELDVFYPAPGLLDLRSYKYPRLKLGHRQRRDVWGSFEAILDASGVNGQACILRTICEAQKYLDPASKILAHDLLRTLFYAPKVGGPPDVYTSASSLVNCSTGRHKKDNCPFSLLELILSHEKI